MTLVQEPAVGLDIPVHGQLIEVTPGEYDWIRLWFAGDVPATAGAAPADEVWLHYRDGADPEWLHLAATTRVPVPRHGTLTAFRLPDRPGVRLAGYRLVPGRAS
jgi:hypothetical protein